MMSSQHWIYHMHNYERIGYEPCDLDLAKTWRCFQYEVGEVFVVAWKPYMAVPGPVTLNEVAALGDCKHENIISLTRVRSTNEGVYLVFENFKDAFGAESPRVNPTTDYMKSVMQQALSGLSHCHGRNYVHRNLTPENLKLDKDGRLKLYDFGFVQQTEGSCLGYPDFKDASLKYKAPEVLLNLSYYKPVDIWSLGVIFFNSLIGEELFTGNSAKDVIESIFYTMGVPLEDQMPGITSAMMRRCLNLGLVAIAPSFTSIINKYEISASILNHQAIDLLSKMLVLSPSGRISAEDALNHPYFTNADVEFGAIVPVL